MCIHTFDPIFICFRPKRERFIVIKINENERSRIYFYEGGNKKNIFEGAKKSSLVSERLHESDC